MRAVTAHTTSGPVRGRVDDHGMTVFKGIPYASPPVGERRFLAPAPPDPWLGTRDAHALGPGCWQVPSPTLPVGPSMDEDCLYLNVWTPAAATGGARPVMVWLHGGAFHFGSFLHGWDTFHYYLGAKYFRELSYDRLYDCATVADTPLAWLWKLASAER